MRTRARPEPNPSPELYGAKPHQPPRTLTPRGVTILLSTFNILTEGSVFSILRQVSDFTTRAVFVFLPKHIC